MIEASMAAAGAGEYLGIIIVAVVVIGSMIMRARAEAKARERRAAAARDEPPPAGATPGVWQPAEPTNRPPPSEQVVVGEPVVSGPTAQRQPATPPRPAVGRSIRLERADVVPSERASPRTPRPVGAGARRRLTRFGPAPEPGIVVLEEPSVQVRAALQADLTAGPAGLRKAILLAEILGPPRALKPLEHRLGGPMSGV